MTAFNSRGKHLELLKLMKAHDPTMMVKSVHDDKQLDNFVEFPLCEEYKEHFNLTDSKPPRGSR